MDGIFRSEVHCPRLRIAGAALCQQPHFWKPRLVIFQSTRRGEIVVTSCVVDQIAPFYARFGGVRGPWCCVRPVATICDSWLRLEGRNALSSPTIASFRQPGVPRNDFLHRCDFCVGQEITQALLASGDFETMTPRMDEDEHSIEMHLPFIKKARNTAEAII